MGTLQLAAACAAQARPRTILGVCWPWVDATLGHPIPGHGASEGVDPSAAGELSADGSPPRLAAAWHAQHRAARGRIVVIMNVLLWRDEGPPKAGSQTRPRRAFQGLSSRWNLPLLRLV